MGYHSNTGDTYSTVQVNRTSVALNQIELDLLRTLPNNHHYHNPDDKGVCSLVFLLFNYHHGDDIDCDVEKSFGSIQLV